MTYVGNLGSEGTNFNDTLPAGAVGLLGYTSALWERQYRDRNIRTLRGEDHVAGRTSIITVNSRAPLSALRDTTTVANGATVTQQNGGEYRLLARMPEDPSLN